MSNNWELMLLKSVLERPDTQDRTIAFRDLLEAGLKREILENNLAVLVFAAINQAYERPSTSGRIPSLQTVQEQLPNVYFPAHVIESPEDLLEKVKAGHIKRRVERDVQAYYQLAKTDPQAAFNALRDQLNTLSEQSAGQADVLWEESAMEGIEEDLAHMDEGQITGLPFPWEEVNDETGGIQPGDLILMWAIPKSKKTWIGMYIAAHLFSLGYRVVIYSKEMTWDATRRRVACLLAGVDYRRFKKRLLTTMEQDRVRHAIRLTTDDEFPGKLIFTTCDKPDGSPGGPAEVQAKIEAYRPDFVFLDSSYKLKVPGAKDAYDWKAIGTLTSTLKQIAIRTGVPMCAVLQENERSALKYSGSGGRGTESIAMYSGVAMDCDLGIKVVNRNDLKKTSLIFAACRETEFEGFTIHSDLCENMGFAGYEILEPQPPKARASGNEPEGSSHTPDVNPEQMDAEITAMLEEDGYGEEGAEDEA